MRADEEREVSWWRNLAVLMVLFLTVLLSVKFAGGRDHLVPLWPASGIAAVLLFRAPRRQWPVLSVLMLLTHLGAYVLAGRDLTLSLMLAPINTAEALGVATFICWGLTRPPRMRNQGDLLRLLLGVIAMAGPMALLCALVTRGYFHQEFGTVFRTVTWSHAAWIITICGVALSWSQSPSRRDLESRWVAPVSILVVVLGLMSTPLAEYLPGFLVYPVVIWSTLRSGMRVVSLQVLLVAVVFSTLAILGRGPYALHQLHADSPFSYIASQASIAVLALLALAISVAIEQSDRLKERLAGSSAIFRRSFADSLLATMVLEYVHDRFEVYDANETTSQLFRSSQDDLRGTPLDKLITTSVPMPAPSEVTDQRRWQSEGSVVGRPDITLMVSLVPLTQMGAGNLFAAQLLDISAERAAAADLDAQRRLNDMTSDTAPSLLILTDLGGTLLRANRAALMLLQRDLSEVVGRPLWDVFEDSTTDFDARSVFDAPDGSDIPETFEAGVRVSDGSQRQILWQNQVVRDAAGVPEYAVFTGLDVTEERNATALMRYMLSAPISTSLIGVDPHGQVTLYNTGAQMMLGHDRSGVLGTDFMSYFDPDDLRSWAADNNSTPDFEGLVGELARDPDLSQDRVWVKRNGEKIWVSLSLSDIRDDQQRHLGYLCVAHDVTEMRRGEQLLIAALDKQRQVVDQLRDLDTAKDEFVSTVSHELRTPTTSIVGYAEMLTAGDYGDVPGPQQRALSAITRNADRLIQLANNLLTLNGLASGSLNWTPTNVNVTEVVRDAAETIAPLMTSRSLDLDFSTPDAEVLVRGDQKHLDRVVLNLLSNAIKFTDDGGRVSCTLTMSESEAVLEVADTGIGIPESEQHNIGEKFWRSTTAQVRQIQGTGLGLAIVHAIVEAHGGEVTLVSEHMLGTTVTVRLPLADSDESAVDDSGAAQAE